MSHRIVILILFLLPVFAWAQTDLLILKNNRSNVFTYTTGTELMMKTIYDQWLHGTISDMRHDSIYMNGSAFHYREVAAIRIMHGNFSNSVLAAGMLVAGGGIFVLGAVNGLYRGDKSKDWYTGSGLVTGGALLVVGYLLTKTRYKTYRLGNKYKLEYLTLNPDKK